MYPTTATVTSLTNVYDTKGHLLSKLINKLLFIIVHVIETVVVNIKLNIEYHCDNYSRRLAQ